MDRNGSHSRDFPIGIDQDAYVTRREFTRLLVLASGAAVAGNGYFVLRRKQLTRFGRTEVAHVGELKPGEVKLFRYPGPDDPAILIRLSNGEHAAYTQRCTHLSCPVQYIAGADRLECPCHNGAFNAATGDVLAGPPPRPLPRIVLSIENEIIYAVGVIGT